MATLRELACGDPFGLVLSGGGARGAFQVGVWEVLRHDRRGLGSAPLIVSGTSAGAINAGLIAAGLTPAAMLEFWLDLARRPPVVANRRFFESLERALAGVISSEPGRRLKQRWRDMRIFTSLLGKHPLHRAGSGLAMFLEFLLTARFGTVSRLLDGITTSYLFSTQPFKSRLAEAIGGYSIPKTDVRVAINAVDVRSGRVVRFVNHRPRAHADADDSTYHYAPEITVDMILASASIPLLFNTVNLGDAELWDGGLLVNTPLAPTVSLGARCVIPVLVTKGSDNVPTDAMTMGMAIERLADAFLENAYNTDRKLLLERNRLARSQPERGLAVVRLFQAIRPRSSRTFNAGSYLYFEPDVLLQMYYAGCAAARDWLAAGPPFDTHLSPDHG